MSDSPALTTYTRFSGCGAKLGPGVLDEALCGLRQPAYPQLLAGFSSSEDAGLFLLDDGLALVQTVDFFPPIVDDPFMFGRIAAANALSDVYAMGARPLTALCLVCYPLKSLGLDSLKAMMEGGLDALIEAGCALLGGHSVEDAEPKLGYAVTGLVDPKKAWRNNTLRPGAALILTKPLGTGLVNMALRAECASEEALKLAQTSMATAQQAGGRDSGGRRRLGMHGHHRLRFGRSRRRDGGRRALRAEDPVRRSAADPRCGGMGCHGARPRGYVPEQAGPHAFHRERRGPRSGHARHPLRPPDFRRVAGCCSR